MSRVYREYVVKSENGEFETVLGFTRGGAGTSTHFLEISKEKFDELSALSKSELDAYVESTLSNAVICGCGYYGAELICTDGMYFLGKCLGNSCD